MPGIVRADSPGCAAVVATGTRAPVQVLPVPGGQLPSTPWPWPGSPIGDRRRCRPA